MVVLRLDRVGRDAAVTFYHQGSAGLEDHAVRHRGVDYFLCGIAGRQFSPRYVERVLNRLRPTVVVPNHYDNFFRPLGDQMRLTLGADIVGFCEDVRAFDGGNVNQSFITGVVFSLGLAVDSSHIYWATTVPAPSERLTSTAPTSTSSSSPGWTSHSGWQSTGPEQCAAQPTRW